MKISGRVKAVTIKGTRWSALVAQKWVSQFFSEKITADLKAALEAVKEGETWEFDIAESTGKDGKIYLNVVNAAKTEDTGQDASVHPDRHEASRSLAMNRSVGEKVGGAIVAAMITAGWEINETALDSAVKSVNYCADQFVRYIGGE